MSISREFFASRLRWVVWVAVGLAGGYALAALQSGSGAPAHDHHALLAEAAVLHDGQQVFTCAMHPQVRLPGPGSCPICGIDLIPVAADNAGDGREEDTAGEAPQLRLTPRSAALMQVDVRPAERRFVQVPVRVFGRLDHDETRLRTISAWVPGRLDELHVDFTGVAVRQGQPMVQLYSPMLIAAQEELLQALRAERELQADGVGVVRESARLTVEASRDRLRLLGLDAAQIERIEARGRPDDHVTIPAPVSGVVIERLASVGDYVETGEPIYRLADFSELWAQLEVYEAELQWLAVGQTTYLRTQSYPGEQFEGTVSFIDPTLSSSTRTARVRVDVANPHGRLKPGMFVRGTVASGVRQAVPDLPEHRGHEPSVEGEAAPLVIPASAPLITGRRAVVYVQLAGRDQPVFEPRDVLLGPRAGDWYIVLAGLEEGDLVVTHGAFKIDSELQIRGQPSMMQPEGGAPPVHDHRDQGAPGRQGAQPDESPDHQGHSA
jgi:Cu(I)/Ag(I) efflux system membrane fusion protein